MASVGQRQRFPVDASSETDEKKGAASLLRELELTSFSFDVQPNAVKADDFHD